MSAKQPNQHLLFQVSNVRCSCGYRRHLFSHHGCKLYVNKDRGATEKLVRGLRKDGYSGLILTVDAAVAGKRERDQRAKGDFTGPAHGMSSGSGAGAGVALVRLVHSVLPMTQSLI
jgi:isopentenyl diphosphate isomerase/L-lactate dehydrogenase-like FMN-dependent dehydrogenase